jgi:hypothetical protein
MWFSFLCNMFVMFDGHLLFFYISSTKGLFWTSYQPDALTATWQHTIVKTETSMPLARLEPTIPASKPPQTQVFDRPATNTLLKYTTKRSQCWLEKIPFPHLVQLRWFMVHGSTLPTATEQGGVAYYGYLERVRQRRNMLFSEINESWNWVCILSLYTLQLWQMWVNCNLLRYLLQSTEDAIRISGILFQKWETPKHELITTQ